MNSLYLSKRMSAIVSLCEENNICDIGADNGAISIKLAENFKEKKILAVENKKGPYSVLISNVKKQKLLNVITSLSDGLNDVTEEFTTCIIAGMGGLNITDIIQKNIDKLVFIDTFIIDAHGHFYEVYKLLDGLGYEVSKFVSIFERKKYYMIVKFVKKVEKVTVSVSEMLFFELIHHPIQYVLMIKNKLELEISFYKSNTKADFIEDSVLMKIEELSYINKYLVQTRGN